MVFKVENRVIKINGFNVPVEIKVMVHEEDDGRTAKDDIHFGNDAKSKRDEREYVARFTRGELFRACIVVEASAYGELGLDSLGACHMHCNNMFNSEPFNKDIEQTLADHCMIDNAIADLVQILQFKARQLNQFA